MSERLRTRPILTGLALLGGVLALAGCTETGKITEGVGNVPLVDCAGQSHNPLSSNTFSVSEPRGAILQLGADVTSKIHLPLLGDDYASNEGDFALKSEGNGKFSITTTDKASIVPSTGDGKVKNTVTVNDSNEQYIISGEPELDSDATSLSIFVSCH